MAAEVVPERVEPYVGARVRWTVQRGIFFGTVHEVVDGLLVVGIEGTGDRTTVLSPDRVHVLSQRRA